MATHPAIPMKEKERTLETVSALVPDPPPRSVVYTFGVPNYVAPGVPVFALGGDFKNAVKVQLRDPTVTGFPMRPPTRWACGRGGMHPEDYFFNRNEGAAYGQGIFVSIPQRRAVTIRSRAQCRYWSARFGSPPL
jgi:hypothetical protein